MKKVFETIQLAVAVVCLMCGMALVGMSVFAWCSAPAAVMYSLMCLPMCGLVRIAYREWKEV